MKNLFFVVLFIAIGNLCYCQKSNDDLITYTGDGFYIVLLDQSSKEVSKVPLGKTPFVFYDKFFKSYSIWFTDENGESMKEKFSFVSNEKDGTIRMTDHQGEIYYLTNKISESGKLVFVREKPQDKYIVLLVVEGVVLNKTDK